MRMPFHRYIGELHLSNQWITLNVKTWLGSWSFWQIYHLWDLKLFKIAPFRKLYVTNTVRHFGCFLMVNSTLAESRTNLPPITSVHSDGEYGDVLPEHLQGKRRRSWQGAAIGTGSQCYVAYLVIPILLFIRWCGESTVAFLTLAQTISRSPCSCPGDSLMPTANLKVQNGV